MNRLRQLSAGRLLISLIGLVLVGAIAIGAGYATRSHHSAGIQVAPRAAGVESVRGVVQSVTSDSITLQTESGPVTLKITASTPKEAIRRASLADIKPGDWINAGGVTHAQTFYALTALVVIHAADLEAGR